MRIKEMVGETSCLLFYSMQKEILENERFVSIEKLD